LRLTLHILSFILFSSLFSSDLIFQKLETIVISGNKITKDYIIKREILHPMDSSLDSLIMLQDINRLYNLGIFSSVDINVDNNTYNINVVESFSILPDIVIDHNETLKKWSYGLGLAHINFLGLNQNLYAGGAFIGEKWFAISLYNPWVYGDHISLRTILYNRFSENPFYDFTFNETYFLVESGFYKGLNNKFQFGLSFYKNKKHTKKYHCSDFDYDEQFECENNGGNWATLLPSNEKNLYKYINIEFNYQYDTRDVYKDPLKGSLFDFNVGYSKSLINDVSDISYFNIFFQKFFLLRIKWLHEPVLSYQISSLLKFPEFNQLPVHEYEYLGGEDYVRGYDSFSFDKYNIENSNVFYSHLELQSTILKKKDYGRIEFGIDGLLFINSGIGSKRIDTFSLDNLLVGYGFGFKFFITGPPPISITFGFNKHGENHTHFEN